jgi:cyclic pyranopterin phosphate synthase
MPKEIFGPGYQFLHREELLTFEEIQRIARIMNGFGAQKIRLTGGEPLLRQDLEELIRLLALVPDMELTITTNGSLLDKKAQILKDAGLDRITVSLDSLEDDVFKKMNGVNFSVARVLSGIEAAKYAGLTPIKINMVVKRGVNDNSVLPLAKYFHGSGHIVRFIEFMDVGSTNAWQVKDVVPAAEIIKLINSQLPIEPIEANYHGEVAKRWRYKDGGGEIGIIASVSQPFCGDCTRVRLSSEGQLYTCLFGVAGHDLRAILRRGASDDELINFIASIWRSRNDRYSEERSDLTKTLPKVEMSYIGG